MFKPKLTDLKAILCLGCHADDIEIGCGGTLLALLRDHPGLRVHWVVLSSAGERLEEARRSAASFLGDAAGHKIVIKTFRDRYFPYESLEIKDFIHSLSSECKFDMVFTHRLEDRHQDHRLVAELTWNAFRDHWILEYEIPKFEGDLGHPNLYVPLEQELCETKIDLTYSGFPSQQAKPWFSGETFRAMLRLRGLECNSPSGYAEAFHCRKMTI